MKSLAIGLLALSMTCSAAAFAHDRPPPPNDNGFLCYFLPFLCDVHHHHHHHDHDHDSGGGSMTAAPEIDPAGAMGALTLLVGGLAALRGRRTKKSEE